MRRYLPVEVSAMNRFFKVRACNINCQVHSEIQGLVGASFVGGAHSSVIILATLEKEADIRAADQPPG